MLHEQVVKILKNGNKRFMNGESIPLTKGILRWDLNITQRPIAAILTCSDSRIIAELAFNQSIGDLFVIRNAGNIVDDSVIASLEFAVTKLEVSSIIVMGHQMCGAVGASLEVGQSYTPAINKILEQIKLSRKSRKDNAEHETKEMYLKKAIISNINYTVKTIEGIESVNSTTRKPVNIIGAYYNITNGKVDFLSNIK